MEILDKNEGKRDQRPGEQHLPAAPTHCRCPQRRDSTKGILLQHHHCSCTAGRQAGKKKGAKSPASAHNPRLARGRRVAQAFREDKTHGLGGPSPAPPRGAVWGPRTSLQGAQALPALACSEGGADSAPWGQCGVTQASTGSAHAGRGREGQADSKLTRSSHAAKKPPPTSGSNISHKPNFSSSCPLF